MQRWISVAAVLTIAASATAQPAATKPADEIVFKLPYEMGKVVRYRMVSRNVGSMKLFAPIPEQNMVQTFTQELCCKAVKKNDDGSVIVEMWIDRVAMSQSFGGMKIDYDSKTYNSASAKDDPARMVARILGAMVGAKFRVTFGADGKPIKTEGVDEMIDKVISGMRGEGGVQGMILDQLANQIGKQLKDTVIKDQLRTQALPVGRRLHVGDGWDDSWEMGFPFSAGTLLRTESTFTVQGFEEFRGRRCAKIHLVQKVSTVAPEKTETQESHKAKSLLDRMKMDLKSTSGEGTLYVDCGTSAMIFMQQQTRIEASVSLEPDPNAEESGLPGEGVNMSMTMRSATTLELVPPDEKDGATPTVRSTTAPAPTVR